MEEPGRPDETLEERERAQIARFSQYVLSRDAWFRIADELEDAMKLLEPQIERFWNYFRAETGVIEKKDNEPPPKYSLINVHMMLAGFVIENLCKGYLAGRLSPKLQEKVKAGKLPRGLKNHDIPKLVLCTGMTFCDQEKDLLDRIGETVIWRGRYPSPSHRDKITPFAQWGNDIERLKMLLLRLRAHVGAKNS